jgi:hypothetical protein
MHYVISSKGETPEFVMPKQIEDFIQVLKENGKKAAAYEYDKIKNELKNFVNLFAGSV